MRLRFREIDCFDQCPRAVKKLEHLQERFSELAKIDQATMQSYVWEEEYTCIILRWCIGYLTNDELKAFLNKAKAHLSSDARSRTRTSEPTSFIIVLDNIAPPGQTWGTHDG